MAPSGFIALALLALAAAAAAYNFNDEDFNELLASELEDWELSSDRSKRDLSAQGQNQGDDDEEKLLKCKHHHGKSCCGKSKWLKHFGDKSKQAVSECFQQFGQRLNDSGIVTGGDPFSCDRVNQMKMKVVCTTECLAKKANMLADDGSLVAEKALEYTSKLELEDWQRPLVEAAVTKCAPTANNTRITTPSTGDIACNTVLLSLQHCLFTEVEKNCPEEHKKTETVSGTFRPGHHGKCKKMYEKIKNNSI